MHIDVSCYIPAFEKILVHAMSNISYAEYKVRKSSLFELTIEYTNEILAEFNAKYIVKKYMIEFESQDDATEFLLRWS